MSESTNSNSKADNAEINEMEEFLKTDLDLDEKQRQNIILFIGVTGTGKSTLSLYLADSPKLRAVRGGSTGDFYITDGDEKISSASVSKTLFPELVPIPNSDIVLADCPGFNDTRSPKYDIAAAIYTRKLLEKAQRVKIVLVVAHHSCRVGVERQGFTNLLAHVAQFIKDIGKAKDSIGLLVTKVENHMGEINDAGVGTLIPDDNVISGIGSFIKTIREEITERQDKEKIVQLLNILTTENANETFPKIGILRRPTSDKNLNENVHLVKNKKDIINMLTKVLQPMEVDLNDFQLSVAAESKILLKKLQDIIKSNMINILNAYLDDFIDRQVLRSKTENIDATKTEVLRNLSIIELLKSKSVSNITNLMERFQESDSGQPNQPYTDWIKQQDYMRFLDSICPMPGVDTNDISNYQTKVNAFEDKLTANIQLMEGNAEMITNHEIGKVITEVVTAFLNEKSNSSQSSCIELSKQIASVQDLCQSFKVSQDESDLPFKKFLNNLRGKFNIEEDNAKKFASFQTDIDFFKAKGNPTFTDGQQIKWLHGFNAPLNDLTSLLEWNQFITESYKILVDKNANNIENLKNWEDFKKFRKQFDTDENSNRIMDSLSTLSTTEQTNLDNLVDSLQLLSSSPHEFSFASSKLVVTDIFVKLSKIKTEIIPKCSSFKELYIFAAQTVIIDASLLAPGKNIYIIAPIWVIEGPQKIDLRGLDATPDDELIFSKPGNPGQTGGSFTGIGDFFYNGYDLTIDVSGGNGGNGTVGEVGKDGANGINKNDRKIRGSQFHSVDTCPDSIKSIVANATLLANGTNKFRLNGEKGTCGSKGGDGGKPGNGGRSGKLKINSNQMNTNQQGGKPGIGGKGGKGGAGGKHADNQIFACVCPKYSTPYLASKILCWVPFVNVATLAIESAVQSTLYHEYEFSSSESQGNAENGKDGDAGTAGIPVNAADSVVVLHKTKVAEQYKAYIQSKKAPYIDPLKFINSYILQN